MTSSLLIPGAIARLQSSAFHGGRSVKGPLRESKSLKGAFTAGWAG